MDIESKRERASSEEGADDLRATTETAQGAADALFKDLQVRGALPGQRVLLHPSPEPLVGIQFGGIGGEGVDVPCGGGVGAAGPGSLL